MPDTPDAPDALVHYLCRQGGIITREDRVTIWPDGRAHIHRWSVRNLQGQDEQPFQLETNLLAALRQDLDDLDLTTLSLRYHPPYVNASYEALTHRGHTVKRVPGVEADFVLAEATETPSSPHDLPLLSDPSDQLSRLFEFFRKLTRPVS